MELLEQCRSWNKNGDYKKVVDALEILPDNARTPDLDLELGMAYCKLGDQVDNDFYVKSYTLLLPQEEYFRGNYRYYVAIGYDYFRLQEFPDALYYFKKAFDAKPGDKNIIALMDECVDLLSGLNLKMDMSERATSMWEEVEENIREYNKCSNKSDADFYFKIADIIGNGIQKVYAKTKAYIKEEGRTLDLEAGDDKSNVFILQYIKNIMPDSLRDLVKINVGISKKENVLECISFEGVDYDITKLRFFVTDDRNIVVYADKFDMPLVILARLFIDTFGQIDLMVNDFAFYIVEDVDFYAPSEDTCYIVHGFNSKEDFLKECVDYKALRKKMRSKGFKLGINADEYLKMYSGYQLKYINDKHINDKEEREDVYIGTTCLPSLISEYSASNYIDRLPIIDRLYNNGVMAGFFCFGINEKKDQSNSFEYEFEIMNLRNQLAEYITEKMKENGKEYDINLLEGATGTKYGYLDFLAFGSLKLIVDIADGFFKKSDVSFAGYRTFRKIARTLVLVEEK